MNDEIASRLAEVRETGEAICAALNGEYQKLGFAGDALPGNPLAVASYLLKKDTFSGEHSLEGVWNDARGCRNGAILFHADGTFYAEYDVVKPHPSDSRWFVEAVTAWGRGSEIKSEARLLPSLE